MRRTCPFPSLCLFEVMRLAGVLVGLLLFLRTPRVPLLHSDCTAVVPFGFNLFRFILQIGR